MKEENHSDAHGALQFSSAAQTHSPNIYKSSRVHIIIDLPGFPPHKPRNVKRSRSPATGLLPAVLTRSEFAHVTVHDYKTITDDSYNP